jgi:predicted lysophospholipase L1 biosynthesis ABC-type transport system permease subunit
LSRIQAVNTIKLSEHLENLWKDGARLTREFNITSAELDVDSYIQWAAPLSGEVSLDQWFALSLGVWVGDSITFFIQWRTFDLEVTSLRESQRDWTWPFFYIQFPDPQFATAPKTYFRVADIAADKKDAFKETLLSTLWTHLSFIDTDEIIETVTDITSKLILVIRILVWCLLVFVWVSIAVCLDAMKSLKKQKVILYGLLWATPPMIRTSLRSEQITLFGVALISATLLATVVVIYSFMSSEFLQGSWWIVLQIILILIVSFGAILGMIKLMYRDIV